MQQAIQDLPEILQLSLARITRNLEVKSGSQSKSLFEPCVRSIFEQEEEDRQTAFLVLTKEDQMSSTKFKIEVFNEIGPKQKLAQIKEQISQILSYQLRITLTAGKEILASVLGMITIPAQDVKDVGTIVSLHSYYENVLQRNDDKLDNFLLDQFVINLAVFTAATYLLRIVNSSAEIDTEEQGEKCRYDFLGFSFNLHKIPYVTEAFLHIETIKDTLDNYKKRKALEEQQGKAENTPVKSKANSIWKDICATSEDIAQTEKRIERNSRNRSNIKIVSCLGDIIQGSTMMILMLRSDLRIRGLLGLTKAANNIGMDPSK